SLPAIILPYVMAVADMGGEKHALKVTELTNDSTLFTVLTYSKMSGNHQYDRVAKLLDCTKYDAILMQEIPDMDELLQAHPELTETCNISYVGIRYKSLALFTPHKIVFEQPSKDGNLFVIQSDVLGQVALLTNRVDKSLNQPVRIQIQQVSNMLDQLKGVVEVNEVMPTIVAGDFNSTPFNTVHFLMRQEMAYAKPNGFMNQTFTFPAEGRRIGFLGPLIRIDHIFYRNMALETAEVLDDSYGSDHYPVKAEFRLPRQEINKDSE
ncbi:MAG: endonuclease/exonuclease/phosphatase family protein, partial [Oleibacter sp.]|nr:endonuclease/exonuclease/phosphatase family protein [Thalassolituus sp.]